MSPASDDFDGWAAGYEAALAPGLRLSGEDRDYFARGRVAWLVRELQRRGFHTGVRRVLDYGCGDGRTAMELRDAFPCREVLAVDSSSEMLRAARGSADGAGIRFERLEALDLAESDLDLAYVSNVFHHIEPARRPAALRRIFRALRPGGLLAFFENNPWNPGARAVMARVPFDRDAVPLSVLASRRLIAGSGFEVLSIRSLFYFPRFLSALRPLERLLEPLPLGAQCVVLARK